MRRPSIKIKLPTPSQEAEARVVDRLGPRPVNSEDAPILICPHHGGRRPEGYTDSICIPCWNTGHRYRLMTPEELRWSAAVQAELGYSEVATRRLRFANEAEKD